MPLKLPVSMGRKSIVRVDISLTNSLVPPATSGNRDHTMERLWNFGASSSLIFWKAPWCYWEWESGSSNLASHVLPGYGRGGPVRFHRICILQMQWPGCIILARDSGQSNGRWWSISWHNRNGKTTFKNPLVVNLGYDADEAYEGIAEGKFDAVAFGTKFLANPDLPERFMGWRNWMFLIVPLTIILYHRCDPEQWLAIALIGKIHGQSSLKRAKNMWKTVKWYDFYRHDAIFNCRVVTTPYPILDVIA